ncbi:MAG: YraN family protein [Alphaproteobacteria bacterium]|jgi:putative endonuclease|nr:YraN family protein [Alphaproteobacteria bacterium]MBT5390286.1 YraN family protein [Alphaproteobacteria bacterium]MBT5540441.1 YraN family protein [Alphaproteobacteria bacterium]MBT5654243.1 YraN family protein [Alphaproteobacteria bacterium]
MFCKSDKKQRGFWGWWKGKIAEHIAVILLILKGYRILQCRYKTHVGEIDIIATRGKLLIMVEVKYRPNLLQASESVTFQQRKRIEKTSTYFLSHFPHFVNHSIRYDVILLTSNHWPVHLKGAWL